jgi:acyl carrier protein
MQTSQENVIKLISEATKINIEDIKPETNFFDDLNLDSLDIVELMMKMEDDFNIEIPEEDAESLKTVQDVVKYLESKQTPLS